MKALKDLSKEELLSFIYNIPSSNADIFKSVDIFSELADCFSCGMSLTALYHYECDDCQKANAEDEKNANQ